MPALHRTAKVALSLCAAASLLVAGAADAQAPYGWTISASSTDPDVNTASVQELGTYYLWLKCSAVSGVQAAQIGLSTGGAGVHTCMVTENGWLNAGDADCLLLAAPGCPTGPVRVATIVVSNCSQQPFSLCIVPCDPFGGTPKAVTIDCATTSENPIDWTGLDVGGGSCGSGTPVCGTVGTESMSWGKGKGRYR
jgi:hypothetical protein